MDKINYPELGMPSDKHQWYGEGQIYEHPSGNKYIVQNGDWVLIERVTDNKLRVGPEQ